MINRIFYVRLIAIFTCSVIMTSCISRPPNDSKCMMVVFYYDVSQYDKLKVSVLTNIPGSFSDKRVFEFPRPLRGCNTAHNYNYYVEIPDVFEYVVFEDKNECVSSFDEWRSRITCSDPTIWVYQDYPNILLGEYHIDELIAKEGYVEPSIRFGESLLVRLYVE